MTPLLKDYLKRKFQPKGGDQAFFDKITYSAVLQVAESQQVKETTSIFDTGGAIDQIKDIFSAAGRIQLIIGADHDEKTLSVIQMIVTQRLAA